MAKTAPRLASSESSLSLSELELHSRGWLLDGQMRMHSVRTQEARGFLVEKLLWFLRQHEYAACGGRELKAFLAYISTAHLRAEGRWGNPHERTPIRPRTLDTYFGNLRRLFAYLVEEGVIESSPMAGLRAPIVRADQIQPFTPAQVAALVGAARKSRHPKRDEATVLFLLDTGCRATELCQLRLRDLDLSGRACTVLGKGNKHRPVYFGRDTTRALWQYLKAEPREPEEFLFLGERGTRAGEPLTRSGLLQLIRRLGKVAGVEATRCSPHTFRHTFAVEFLRAGQHLRPHEPSRACGPRHDPQVCRHRPGGCRQPAPAIFAGGPAEESITRTVTGKKGD